MPTNKMDLNTSNNLTASSSLSDWLTYMQQIHVSAIDMGLSRVLPVAERLGLVQSAQQDAYVFTVAGTNGKGSTTAVIAEICGQAGYKTALYQSPHLLDFNERVRINGAPVGDALLTGAFAEVEAARLACGLTLSFFEMTTLAALLIFAQAQCEVWVLEVGLGGRLDVVNIIDPSLAVITNIGIDHVEWLGDTREKIAVEKAGILRHGVTLVYGEADMPSSILPLIDALQVNLIQYGKDYAYFEEDALDDALTDGSQNIAQSADPQSISPVSPSRHPPTSTLSNQLASANTPSWYYSSPAVTLALPLPSLSVHNAATAVTAVLASKLTVTQSHIATALAQVRLAGRFDRRQLAGRTWLFDVAHNEHGMNFLLAQFVPYWQAYQQQHPSATLYLVFSMLADKDIQNVLNKLAPLPFVSVHSGVIDHPRGADREMLSALLAAVFVTRGVPVMVYDGLAEATDSVIEHSAEGDLILVCGSFHTIGEVIQHAPHAPEAKA